MRRRILFLVNGLGLGNSTRCYAVIQRLIASGHIVEIVTSDNGLWFFRDKSEVACVTEAPSLHYGKKDGRISIAATLAQIRGMAATLKTTKKIVAETIERFRPHAVVTDSFYGMPPLGKFNIPWVALNNSDMVMQNIWRFRKDVPVSVLPQLVAIEAPDFLFHLTRPDIVISPRLDTYKSVSIGPFRCVGPIVRSDCAPTDIPESPTRRIVIMLSGSAFGSPVALRQSYPSLQIDILGRGQPIGVHTSENIIYHDKVRDALQFLKQADLVIVNGGFSAVSEAVVLRKPTVVIPVPRHAEQWVNGRTVAEMGIGMTASEQNLEDAMQHALTHIGRFRDACRAIPLASDGAFEAAKLIISVAKLP